MATRRHLTALIASVVAALALTACAEFNEAYDEARQESQVGRATREPASDVEAGVATDDVVACQHFKRFADAGVAGDSADALAALDEAIRSADSAELRGLFAEFKDLILANDVEAVEDLGFDLGLRCGEILIDSGVAPEDL